VEVAVVLPGASYGPDMPGLAIPVEVLREHGARVTVVEYPAAPWPDWRRAEAGDWTQVRDAIAPQIAPELDHATRVTLLAKSMGTSVFGGVRQLFPPTTRAIWITPLFADPDVRRDVIASKFRCLSVFAHDDPSHDPDGQAAVTAACNGVEFGFDVGGHRLTMSDAQRAQLRAAVESFVA
jgi:hypothetical protein